MSNLKNWLFFTPSPNPREEGRLYSQLTGSNYIFLFGGRLRTLKNTQNIQIYVLVIILAPMVLYLIFEAPWLWHHVSPGVVIMWLYCWVSLMVNFIKALGLDPGILPKNVHITDDPLFIPKEYLSVITLPSANRFGEVEMKYCNTCRIWRLPRSSHCSTCNCCIMYHDHHCKYINNCVGQRNYSFFMGFLQYTLVTLIYLIVTSFVHLNNYNRDLSTAETLTHIPVTLLLIIYGFILMLYPLAVLSFQYFMVANLITTREYLHVINDKTIKGSEFFKTIWNTRYNTGSVLRNFSMQLFRPRGVSGVRMRDRVLSSSIVSRQYVAEPTLF